MKTGCAVLAVLGLATACGGDVERRSQWLVSISTDAQIPHFGDRVLVELRTESEDKPCSGCRRIFGARSASDLPISFGIIPPKGGERLLLRATLFRSISVGPDGLPAGSELIDSSGYLPSDPGPVGVQLAMRCFGRAGDDPLLSCDPSTGQLGPLIELGGTPLATGSWEPGWLRDCSGPAPPGMVCVPGGAFLLGSSSEPPSAFGALEPRPERLVAVHPFFMDLDEVRVGQVRAIAGQLSSLPTPQPNGTNPTITCTYRADGANDDLPVNCVDRFLAEEICQRLGKRLPTEAEWEYAATSAVDGAERSYPWGEDPDVCDWAVIAFGDKSVTTHDASCRGNDLALPPGLRAGGDEDDATPLGIKNLAGNVQEWVMDDFGGYDDPCWDTDDGFDPQCQLGSAANGSVRGAAWTMARQYARAATRSYQSKYERLVSIGVRCATSAE